MDALRIHLRLRLGSRCIAYGMPSARVLRGGQTLATAAAVLVMARRTSDSPVVHQHDTQVPRDEFKKFGRLALDGLIKQVLSGHERLSQKRGRKDKNVINTSSLSLSITWKKVKR